jgi:hypothetical protein
MYGRNKRNAALVFFEHNVSYILCFREAILKYASGGREDG